MFVSTVWLQQQQFISLWDQRQHLKATKQNNYNNNKNNNKKTLGYRYFCLTAQENKKMACWTGGDTGLLNWRWHWTGDWERLWVRVPARTVVTWQSGISVWAEGCVRSFRGHETPRSAFQTPGVHSLCWQEEKVCLRCVCVREGGSGGGGRKEKERNTQIWRKNINDRIRINYYSNGLVARDLGIANFGLGKRYLYPMIFLNFK